MNRKPLPSEIKEQKDVWITEFEMDIHQPNMMFNVQNKLIYHSSVCDKCGKVNDRKFPFIKGWDCECK